MTIPIALRNKLLFLVLYIFLFAVPVFAQDRPAAPAAAKGDLWICPGADVAMFSISHVAYGGGVALGYGRGTAIGFRAAWFIDGSGQVTTLEFSFLLRLYFLGAVSCSGPFIQLTAGPVLFAEEENMAIPSSLGVVSAGLSVGWRFLLGRYLYIEPAIRGGYPYIAGVGVSAGIRW